MKKFTCLSLAIILLFACEESAFEVYTQSENHQEYQNELTLSTKGIKVFPLDNETGFWNYSVQFDTYEDKEYLSILNFLNNSILLYDYESRQLEKKIVMPYEGPDGVGTLPQIASHLMISPDSFLVYNIDMGRLFMVNDQAKVIRKYDIIDYQHDNYSAPPQPSTLNPMIKLGDDLYIPCALNDRLEDYSDFRTVLKLDLQTGQKTYEYPLPEIYNQANWGEDFKYLVSLAYNSNESKLVLNYPVDPFLYAGSKEGVLKESHYVGSDFIASITPWRSSTANPSDGAYKQRSEFSMSTSDYPGIIYDHYKNLYYRISYLRPSLDVVKTGYRLPNFSFIIMNPAFEKIGEVKFDSRIYDQSMIFVSEDGINLARKDLYSQDENSLSYEYFAVEAVEQ